MAGVSRPAIRLVATGIPRYPFTGMQEQRTETDAGCVIGITTFIIPGM